MTYNIDKDIERVAECGDFKWRDRKGNMLSVLEMKTSHLFYTLRMIWNHTMPQDAIIPSCNMYRFPEFYTECYMKQAIRNIMPVLFSRELNTYQTETLLFMKDYFTKKMHSDANWRLGAEK